MKKISGEERKTRDKLLRLCMAEAYRDSKILSGIYQELNESDIQTVLTELAWQKQHYENRAHEPLAPLTARSISDRIKSLEIIITDLQERANQVLNFTDECAGWPAAQAMNEQYFNHKMAQIKFFTNELQRLKNL